MAFCLSVVFLTGCKNDVASNESQTPTPAIPVNAITLGLLSVSNQSTNGFSVQTIYSGDVNQNAAATLRYCNATDSPGCAPASGNAVPMQRANNVFTANITNLSPPNDPGDTFNLSVSATDVDGVSGSPKASTVTLRTPPTANAITLQPLVASGQSSSSFTARIDYTGDANQNAVATLYFCNSTDTPNCVAIGGRSVFMQRNGNSFLATVNNLATPDDPGDNFNLSIVASDPDGINASPQHSSVRLLQNVVFADGFESGNLSHNVGAYWWNSVGTSVEQTNPHTGSYSLRMRYGAKPMGQDSYTEQRLRLNGNYTDLWLKYDIFIPANYYHRVDNPSNNKFTAIYRDPYQTPGFHMNISVMPTGTGDSDLEVNYYNNGVSMSPIMPSIGRNFITAAERNRWNRIVIHVKVPTGNGTADGVIQVWKNGVQVCNLTNMNNYGSAGQNYMNELYLLGWANSGFTDDTVFYIDDVLVSDSPISAN